MGREILPLTLDRLPDLPGACGRCLFWELGPAQVAQVRPGDDALDAKEGWLTTVLLEWGSPGRVAYVDGVAVGWIGFAPAHLVPRSAAFATSPVSQDAVVLTTAHLLPEYRGTGLGRVLVQAAAKDGLRRGVRALEAYGSTRLTMLAPGSAGPVCVLPSDFLRAVGFRTTREHPTSPRLRLDLRTVVRWRSEVEQAVERLFAPVRGLGAPAPVGAAHRDDPTAL